MKYFFLSIVLFFFHIVSAQSICVLDEEFGLLYIDKKTKVTIETMYLKPSPFAGMGGVEEFIVENDTVKAVAYNYGDDPGGILFSVASYSQYPSLIKVKNNSLQIVLDPKDSTIFDEKGRVIECYLKNNLEKSGGTASLNYIYKFNYINDTTVAEIVTPPQGKATLTAYYLNKSHNLKMVKNADIDYSSKITDLSKLQFRASVRFFYDRFEKRILSIRYYVNNRQHKSGDCLIKIHRFVYKSGRPIKSYLTNVKTMQIEYQQLYKYNTVR